MQNESMNMDQQLLVAIQNHIEGEIIEIGSKLEELSSCYQERLQEEELSNKSLQLAQSIQMFLQQNKTLFLNGNQNSEKGDSSN